MFAPVLISSMVDMPDDMITGWPLLLIFSISGMSVTEAEAIL